MKRLRITVFLGILLLVAAGCQDQQEAAPTAEPATAVPEAVEPTAVPAASAAETTVDPVPPPVEESDLPAELTAQLDAYLQSQVYSEGSNPEGAAPGLVLLVDTPQGTYLNAAGVSSLEKSTPMQVNDRLEIGSNTKSFTIAVLMQLQEEGLLSFDDMLSDWLPDLAAQIPNGDQITLRQLAAHTSGIWDYGDAIIGEATNDPAKLEVGYTPEELVQYAIDNGTPDFAPGEGWKYSNTGYILLGMIAEQASGRPLGELLQERIFDPLGLGTAELINGVPEAGSITDGYWFLEDGTRLNSTNWNASQGWAAGANAMTATDLATYGKALAAGELFQDPESLAQMLAFDDRALFTGGAPFGLGLIDFGNGTFGHEGQTAGFQSLWYTNPEQNITVVGLTNSAAYSAFGFLNVLNILNGSGAQPFQPVTLLPLGDSFPAFALSNWEWVRATSGADVVEIPAGFILSLAKDSSATLSSTTCGPVGGAFTADAQSQIGFDLDTSAVTCAEGDPLLELVAALQSGGTWRFENGGIVISLAGDDGELTFLPAPPPEEVAAASCPLYDLPYPRPEPAYSGKVARDLTPFAEALAAYTAEDAAAREALVSGRSIPELQALMDSGDLTAVDLVVYYLERIQRYDVDKLNAVLELNPDVLQVAQALDDERAAGAVRGQMHGIPVLLKDNIATGDDLHTAAGAAAMLGWDPSRDAFLVQQLRDAGAVILGKANLSEWANYMNSCMPNGFSANGGQTQNPYGPFETYGSSSGSAVAVAADLATVSVGTETQGSIIAPAGINSVVGLKPTKGLISTDYVIPLLPFQDVPGPMGRTVTDVAVLLSALTGVDEKDFTTAATADLAGVDFTQFLNAESLAGIRVGVPLWNEEAFEAYFTQNDITDETEQANLREALGRLNVDAQAVIDALTTAGVEVVEIPSTAVPPNPSNISTLLEYGFQQAINDFLAGLGDEAPVASLEEIIAFNNEDPANRAPYGQDYLQGSANTAITLEEFASQQQLDNGAARNGIDVFFRNYEIDVVVSDLGQAYAPAGYPALTVPAGYAEDGTPDGTVFTGLRLSEPQLLAVGYAYEQASQARVAPDLEATMRLINAMPDQAGAGSTGSDDGAFEQNPPPTLADTFGNLTYSGVLPDQPIALENGTGFYDDGGSGTPYVRLMDNLIATGDLNDDGEEDAAFFMVDNTTGSGNFVYLVPVLDIWNQPTPLAALLIGDRIPVKSLAISGGQVVADLVMPVPGDPACCPTRSVRGVYELEDGRLVERSTEDMGEVSLEDLNGISWQLVNLNLDQEAVLPDVEITFRMDDDQITGSGGCNNYRSFAAAGDLPQDMTIAPIAATRMMCAEGNSNQEATYFDRLGKVVAWRHDFGNLALTYKLDDGALGELIFVQQ